MLGFVYLLVPVFSSGKQLLLLLSRMRMGKTAHVEICRESDKCLFCKATVHDGCITSKDIGPHL